MSFKKDQKIDKYKGFNFIAAMKLQAFEFCATAFSSKMF